MLLPLLFLFAAAGLTDTTVRIDIDKNTQLDTSGCPITFYGQEYSTFYTNFTGQHLILCFNGFYTPDSNGDCIKLPNTDNRATVLLNYELGLDNVIYLQNLFLSEGIPITHSFTCIHLFSYVTADVALLVFGPKSLLLVLDGQKKFFSVLVNGNVVENAFTSNPDSVISDMSGCRFSGLGVSPGTTRQNLETCSSMTCSSTSIASMKTCSPPGQCDGNGTCSGKGLCTVTGPTIIDFSERLNSVSDRCEYSLLHDQSTGFSLKANFLERRRRDVSFVDSVTLDFSDRDDIQLLQGHRVMKAGSPLTLTSSVQTFSGVDVSKDQTGVTAGFSLQGSAFSVFYDGTTVQISINVLAGKSYTGLCANSSSSSSSRLSSDASCLKQFEDKADDKVNCTAMTQQCNVLKSAPFFSCNSIVDPQPYITACTETMCKYPDEDGLRCQFLEAYAKVCEKKGVNLQSWWTAAQCSNSTVMCQNTICSDHEFCGDLFGTAGCRCRAIFATPYLNSSTFGGPTICEHNSASLTLVKCLLDQKGINSSSLTLLDKTCKGQMDEKTHMLTFNFTSNSCGTIVSTNNSQVIFTNAVTLTNEITRKDQAYFEFSCFHKKPEVNHVGFRIQDSPVVQNVTSGIWNHTVTMVAYADASRTQMVDANYQVQLNQKIWVELKSSGLDENVISTVTDSCWATNHQSSDSPQKYFLIQNGCANLADETVQVERNGDGILNYFSFNMFKFNDASRDVFLHCKLQLCLRKEENCIPECSSQAKRRRRSVPYKNEGAAFLSMGWSA